jgi:hypothetical protein
VRDSDPTSVELRLLGDKVSFELGTLLGLVRVWYWCYPGVGTGVSANGATAVVLALEEAEMPRFCDLMKFKDSLTYWEQAHLAKKRNPSSQCERPQRRSFFVTLTSLFATS